MLVLVLKVRRGETVSGSRGCGWAASLMMIHPSAYRACSRWGLENRIINFILFKPGIRDTTLASTRSEVPSRSNERGSSTVLISYHGNAQCSNARRRKTASGPRHPDPHPINPKTPPLFVPSLGCLSIMSCQTLKEHAPGNAPLVSVSIMSGAGLR